MTDLPYSRRILELADKWIGGSITEIEKKEFIDWYQRFDDRELLLAPEFEPIIKELEMEMLATIRQRIAGDASPPAHTSAPVRPSGGILRRMKGWKIAAAAVLVLAASLLPLLLTRKTRPQDPLARYQPAPPAKPDILPGGDKALLTLSDGSTIVLDSARPGSLTRQGNTQVVKSAAGALQYKTLAGNDAPITYNILSTPRGGQYRLILPDGSKVWLDAASSIRYPTAFTGTSREVEVAGEAYFEITKDPSMPFRVLAAHRLGEPHPMAIEVLGTAFNVNAYDDEASIRTSLLEGSVRLVKGQHSGLLKPGQQVQTQDNGEMQGVPEADMEKAVAWKNGLFEFDDETLPAVMRQLSRWYDVDVVYEGKIPADRFSGRISRKTTLAGVFRILKLSDVRFTIEDKKIIVRS